MENWNTSQMTPFDRQTSSETLFFLKLIIPYLPPQSQRLFAIYIKYLEFQNTLSSFQSFKQKSFEVQTILQDIKPYISPSVSDSIDNLMNMMSMMEMFQSMQNDSGDENAFDPMSMMAQMLTPEQQGMFEMYNEMFANNDTLNSKHGGDTSA